MRSWLAFCSAASRWASCLAMLIARFWSAVAAFSASLVSSPSAPNILSCLPLSFCFAAFSASAITSSGCTSAVYTPVSISGSCICGSRAWSSAISCSACAASCRSWAASSNRRSCSACSAATRCSCARSRRRCAAPPATPNPPPAIAPRTLASMMRSHSLLPKTSGLSSTNRSAAMLIASWAPSVSPSPATPVNKPAVVLRNRPRSMPDFSSTFSTIPAFSGPESCLDRVAGSIESSAAEPAPKSIDVPSSICPVFSNMF